MAGVRLSDLALDPRAKDEGVWVEMPGGWEARIRHNDCAQARKLRAQHLNQNKRFYRNGQPVPEDVAERQTLTVACDALLVDWRGIVDDKGKAVPFSKEKARQLLADPRYRHIVGQIVDVAIEDAAYKPGAEKDAEGNSGTS